MPAYYAEAIPHVSVAWVEGDARDKVREAIAAAWPGEAGEGGIGLSAWEVPAETATVQVGVKRHLAAVGKLDRKRKRPRD